MHKEYVRKLHEVDKSPVPSARAAGCRVGSSYNDDIKHTEGGGEKYLTREFGTKMKTSFILGIEQL